MLRVPTNPCELTSHDQTFLNRPQQHPNPLLGFAYCRRLTQHCETASVPNACLAFSIGSKCLSLLQNGCYVFPVMEGDRLIGRIDANAPATGETLNVTAFWPELTVKMTPPRTQRLEAEIARYVRFTNKSHAVYADDWIRPHDPFCG